MKKTYLPVIAGVALSFSSASYAALSPSAFLMFEGDTTLSTTTMPALGSGSWFALQTGADSFSYTGITSFNGINLGVTQLASGDHSGLPDGTEQPNIDAPWAFFGNTGMHQTESPVTIVSDDNNGNVVLDFSGWSFIWNGLSSSVGLGTGAWGNNPEGQAILTCQFDCSTVNIVEPEFREGFVLDYTATIPPGDPSGLGGIRYQLHLEAPNLVPVPAAVWLFSSGLLGLFAIMRRRRV